MNTEESIKRKIANINKTLLSYIEDKSIFDDAFKDHIIHIKKDNYGPPKYKGRSIECPVFYGYANFDVTKKFSKKSFLCVKEQVNELILLHALGDIARFDTFCFNAFNEPNNKYNKLFTTFAKKKQHKNTEVFIQTLKECNTKINIFVVDILIHERIGFGIGLMIRIGCDFKFKK